MKPQDVQRMLRQTLDDWNLSRTERSAMGRILDHLALDETTLGLYRSMAFDLAREAYSQSRGTEVLDWLEDVIKVMQAKSGSQKLPQAEWRFSPNDDCVHRIVALIESARESIDVCVFTITDDRISNALVAAHRRKIALRVITDDDKSFDRGSDVDRLESAGIPLQMDRSSFHMHHKFAVFDKSLLLTGSYNWTRSASQHNEENFIISGDQRFIVAFDQLFERLWNQFSE
ncbi:MAG: phospholipase D-like domain-containing protein [Planctomycetaceae bacterium]